MIAASVADCRVLKHWHVYVVELFVNCIRNVLFEGYPQCYTGKGSPTRCSAWDTITKLYFIDQDNCISG